MYGWLWRHIPGPLWLRIIIALLLIVAVVLALMTWVFPALSPYMPFSNGNTVDT